jgi:hypothetical protein
LAGGLVDAIVLAYAAAAMGVAELIPPLFGVFISEEAAVFLVECAVEVGREFAETPAQR